MSNHHGVVVHAWQWTLAETLYAHPPRAAGGVLTLTEAAGLGLESREAVLRETALSRR